MRILICDDDINIRVQLEKLLRKFFTKNNLKCPEIAIYENGEDLLKDPGKKDIVFLDVEMPGLDGICVGRELAKHNKHVLIFIVTSFIEYLDDAMRFHVFRYLTKPLEPYRFDRNMKDALRQYNASVASIPIETKEGVYMVSSADIIMLEAQGHTITIHTCTRDYISVHNLKYWKQTLQDSCFFQSHKSFIINLAHVSGFDHTLIYLYKNQFQAYLTKRKYTDFKQAFLLYLEGMN